VRVGPLKRLSGPLAVGALLLATLPFVSTASAQAVLVAPGNLSPDSETVSGMPVLSWSRVTGAAEYDVQISTSPDFSPALYDQTTENRQATPTSNLPGGTDLYWRVRGVTAAGANGRWSNPVSFFHESAQVPTLLTPDDAADLQQPEQTPLLTWSAVDRAVSYTFQIATDDQFVTPIAKTLKGTGITFDGPKPETTYYWHVQANLSGGFASDWSETRTFQVLRLRAPDLVAPDDSATTQIQDAVLDWAPVPGAVRYELQVSTDDQFNTTVIKLDTIKATRYAAAIPNDQYWWRVRGIDASGSAGLWSTSLNQFQRNWPDQPELVYPADGATVGTPAFYQWDGVPHASSYQLEVASDPSFSPGHFDSCLTTGTTYTPGRLTKDCRPVTVDPTYWRVLPIDGPSGINGVYSEIHSFSYDPNAVTQLSPADGATVEVPTLSWETYPSAEKYKVIIRRADGGTTATVTTEATSFTPTGQTRLDPTDGPFHWTVQALLADGSSTIVPLFNFDPTFDVANTVTDDPAVDALEPTSPPSTHGVRPPTLTWEPWFDSLTHAPAAYYRLFYGQVGSPVVNQLGGSLSFPYPAGSDDTVSAPGDYYWFARAYASNGALLGEGATGYFTIDPLATVTGRAVSLDGVGLQSAGTRCARSLPANPSTTDICNNLQQTPVLSWSPVQGAAYYMVYIGRDRELTNMVLPPDSNAEKTVNTVWNPILDFADSQAGTAYYWFIRPCNAEGLCAPAPTKANNAFDKRSNPVGGLLETKHEATSPLPAHGPGGASDPPTFADEIVLSWDDYLATNQAGNASDVTGLPSQVGAKSYKVEISSDPGFSTSASFRHTTGAIDQTSYSPPTSTLPEGLLYWRVQAVDGSGNSLAWSTGRSLAGATPAIQKKSPTPVLAAPVNSQVVSASPAFRWEPLGYAASYDVQVARDGDETFATGSIAATGSKLARTTYVPNLALPTDGNPYLWRVRRYDADGKPGAWSQPEIFRVAADSPAQLSPNPDAFVPSRDAIFGWGSVTGAASYKFERRSQGATTSEETKTTTGLAWAPQRHIEDGKYEWRVTSLDANGKTIGASPWRPFRVDGAAPRVVRKSPVRVASPTAVFRVNFSEAVTGVTSATFKIVPKGSTEALPATVRSVNKHRSATLDPARNLRVGKTYTLKILTGIKDGAGHRLKPVSWTVTVKA
jgi:hypothetical protein